MNIMVVLEEVVPVQENAPVREVVLVAVAAHRVVHLTKVVSVEVFATLVLLLLIIVRK